ncbi:MAG TPA: hypothetical protein DEP48_05770 [Persephonella sp.]|uniref:Uncharacterized protein n=1 Tax=Persephonella marina (strain DSM 14350 / EX-H1) TaxID=123214 RepID=C0QPE0_PERMH|nr:MULTISPECIES: hypothetical protein [Persephonella]ACO04902.1 hypothetical protein PERMA_0748 [Persephonella marina EX-H1]HCB69849.1 hypothetical protein [Persephonella sp.]
MNNFSILKDLAKKLDEEVVILVSDLDNIPKDSIERDLINEGINYKIEVKSSLDEGIEFVKSYSPDLLVLTKEKIDPLEHIFHHTYCEKILEEFESTNILALQEDTDTLKNGLIYVSKDHSTVDFIKSSKYFADRVLENYKFIYSFYEDFYEKRLVKTHTEGEAKQIIAEMFREHVDTVRSLIAKAVGEEKTELLVIKGDPKKEIPYYARKNNYDLLIFNRGVEDINSFIENSETSIGIFLDQTK